MLSQYTKVIYLCCFNNHTGYIKKLSWLKPPFNSQLNHTFGFPFSCIICQAWESIISVRVTDLAVRSTQQPRYFSQCGSNICSPDPNNFKNDCRVPASPQTPLLLGLVRKCIFVIWGQWALGPKIWPPGPNYPKYDCCGPDKSIHTHIIGPVENIPGTEAKMAIKS